MTTRPSPEPDRGSDTTLEANHDDAEKQNHANDDVSAESGHSQHDDVEKAADKADPEAAPPKNPWMDPSSFPDGGTKAWMCVAGAWFALFVSFGKVYQHPPLGHLAKACNGQAGSTALVSSKATTRPMSSPTTHQAQWPGSPPSRRA